MQAAPPQVIQVTFEDQRMCVDLADGRLVEVPLVWFPRLRDASPAQRSLYEISPRGMHWEALDEDVSIAGLLSLLDGGKAPGVRQVQREPSPSDLRTTDHDPHDMTDRPMGARSMNPPLSAGERYEREDAVRQARASMRLSGLPESPELDALCDRYIAGEIELDELLALNGMTPSREA